MRIPLSEEQLGRWFYISNGKGCMFIPDYMNAYEDKSHSLHTSTYAEFKKAFPYKWFGRARLKQKKAH